MPYTLTMTLLWLVLVAVAGVVVGYLFRGRTTVVATGHHPAGHTRDTDPASDDEHGSTVRPTDADELGRLRARVERLDTQLSITTAERDHLRRMLDARDAPAPTDDAGAPVGDTGPAGATAVE